MIDWNLEEQKAITTKTQKEADLKIKKDLEAQGKLDYQIAYKGYCVIFDKVIQEEIDGVKVYLNKYAEFDIEITTGNVKFIRYFERGKHNSLTWQNLSCVNKEGTDLATYTRERLTSLVMYLTVNFR